MIHRRTLDALLLAAFGGFVSGFWAANHADSPTFVLGVLGIGGAVGVGVWYAPDVATVAGLYADPMRAGGRERDEEDDEGGADS